MVKSVGKGKYSNKKTLKNAVYMLDRHDVITDIKKVPKKDLYAVITKGRIKLMNKKAIIKKAKKYL